MSGLLLSGCCNPCAGGGNDPCRDEFEDYYNLARYEYADTPGGAASVALVERHKTWVSSQWVYELELSGDGSFTVEAAPPAGELIVGTRLNPSTVDAGVTVRRADSTDHISLVYIGGDDHELRQGSTVLATVNFNTIPGFRLVLKTPLSTTTDIEVWGFDAITGDPVLQHTESAVTWVPPESVWNVGLVTEGANSQFLYFEGLPCPRACGPPPVCIPAQSLDNPAPVPPISWTCEFPAFSREVDCAVYPESFTLVPTQYARAIDWLDLLPGWLTPAGGNFWDDITGWEELAGASVCNYIGVMESRVPVNLGVCGGPTLAGYPTVYEDQPAGTFAVKYMGVCGGPEPVPNSYGEYTYAFGESREWGVSAFIISIQSYNFGDLVTPDWKFRIGAYYGMTVQHQSDGGNGVIYLSDWISFASTDYIDGSYSLTKYQEAVNCTATPGTLTVTAHRPGSVPIDRRVLQCHDPSCVPPVTPQTGTCYLLNIDLVDADGRPWRMVANLGINFDDTTGSWYWEGGVSPHPLADAHDTCGPMQFGFAKIHCVEPEEGASKSWVLDFTYDGQTERFAMSSDPELGFVWEGTTDIICSGQTWDFIGWGLNAPTGTYQFGSCEWSVCHDPMLYIIPAYFNTECDGGFGYTENGGYLIFTPTSPQPWMAAPIGTVFYSPLPYGYSGAGEAAGIFLYVESGTVRVQIVDGQLEPLQDLFASVGYTCDGDNGNRPVIDDTSPVSYLWGFPSPVTSDPFGICEGTTGFGSWSVSF